MASSGSPLRSVITWLVAFQGFLYYGDNLQVLREHIKDESVDLVYLDHPSTAIREGHQGCAARTLRVERAVSSGEVTATKTDGSRPVDVTPRLADALSELQGQQEARALVQSIQPCPWIFAADDGDLFDANQIAGRFRRTLKLAGLPRFRLYDLRHTYATHLLALGAPITYVAAQLGHSKPTTTLAHYAHWLPRGRSRMGRQAGVGATAGGRGWHQNLAP